MVALQKKGQIRRLLIGFVRESVVNTAICYSKFGPRLEIITMFNKKLPDNKFDITTTLVENLNNQVKEKGSIHHLPNYFNNYTYYYPFNDQIWILEAKYGLDEFKKSLIYSTILSPSPDIYTELTRSKEDHPSFWKNSDYREIGYSIYREIWDEKSNKTSTPGQHAPT